MDPPYVNSPARATAWRKSVRSWAEIGQRVLHDSSGKGPLDWPDRLWRDGGAWPHPTGSRRAASTSSQLQQPKQPRTQAGRLCYERQAAEAIHGAAAGRASGRPATRWQHFGGGDVHGPGLERADRGFLGTIITRSHRRRQQMRNICDGKRFPHLGGHEVGTVVGLDHALVYSCFGIHSSFEFRISPFPSARIPHSSFILHRSSFLPSPPIADD